MKQTDNGGKMHLGCDAGRKASTVGSHGGTFAAGPACMTSRCSLQ